MRRGGYGSTVAPSSRSGTLRAYGRPFVADRTFWLALGVAVVVGLLAVLALLMVLALPRTDGGWAWTVVLGLLSTWIAFVVLSIGLASARGAAAGAAEAESTRADRYERHGRRAGRAVGTGLAAMTGRRPRRDDGRDPSPPDPAPPTDTATRRRTDVDRGANSLGRMVGRRLAEHRRRMED